MTGQQIDRVPMIRQSLAAHQHGLVSLVAAILSTPAFLVAMDSWDESTSKWGGGSQPLPEISLLFVAFAALSLLPAAQALTCWARVTLRFRGEWNPASDYASWGARLGTISMLISALSVGALAVVLKR